MIEQKCPCISTKIAELQSELGPQGNEYLFMRSIWKSQPITYTHALADSDDQLDRINKIVAMMKKHVNYNVCKEISSLNSGWEGPTQIGTREQQMLQQMNKAFMQKQELGGRLDNVMRDNISLKQENQRLKTELNQLKNRARQDSKSIKKLSQKNATLSNKLLASDFNDHKSQGSYMKSSRNIDDLSQSTIKNSLSKLNINVPLTESVRLHNLPKQRSERSLANKKFISVENVDDCQSDTLNQSIIERQLDQSVMSVSNYSFIGNRSNGAMTDREKIREINKQNSEDLQFVFHYESERNLLKERTIVKNRVKCPQKLELGECPQIKFIRQNSKHSLIRKTIKTETTIPSL